jgi:hypothetical protein
MRQGRGPSTAVVAVATAQGVCARILTGQSVRNPIATAIAMAKRREHQRQHCRRRRACPQPIALPIARERPQRRAADRSGGPDMSRVHLHRIWPRRRRRRRTRRRPQRPLREARPRPQWRACERMHETPRPLSALWPLDGAQRDCHSLALCHWHGPSRMRPPLRRSTGEAVEGVPPSRFRRLKGKGRGGL